MFKHSLFFTAAASRGLIWFWTDVRADGSVGDAADQSSPGAAVVRRVMIAKDPWVHDIEVNAWPVQDGFWSMSLIQGRTDHERNTEALALNFRLEPDWSWLSAQAGGLPPVTHKASVKPVGQRQPRGLASAAVQQAWDAPLPAAIIVRAVPSQHQFRLLSGLFEDERLNLVTQIYSAVECLSIVPAMQGQRIVSMRLEVDGLYGLRPKAHIGD